MVTHSLTHWAHSILHNKVLRRGEWRGAQPGAAAGEEQAGGGGHLAGPAGRGPGQGGPAGRAGGLGKAPPLLHSGAAAGEAAA
jgi:hypothetical protein